VKADSKRPAWVEFYHATLLEVDYQKLPQRLKLAEDAIRARLEALSAAANVEEVRAIDDARQNLRVIQRELEGHQVSAGSRIAHSHSEVAGTYMVFVDTNRRYVEVTDGVCQLLGYSRRELLSMTIDEVAAPELRSEVPETFRQFVAEGGLQGEYWLLTKDRRRIKIHYQSKVYPDGCMVARWEPLDLGTGSRSRGFETERAS
jgi:PAS domain S-box-containing protein